MMIRCCIRKYTSWNGNYLAKLSISTVSSESHNGKQFWFSRALKMQEQAEQQQLYNSFFVLDFEATCERGVVIEPQEIIEFPCVKVNGSTCEIEDIYHQYIQPKERPVLTPFCTELTGIMQEMVNNQPCFEEAFPQFQKWLQAQSSGQKSIFVTCGDWDLQVMLPKQCKQVGVEIPSEMRQWINIKKSFATATGHFPKGILDMLSKLQLPHTGRLHSGIDDCHNIVAILKELVSRGFILEKTSQLSVDSRDHLK